MEIKTTITTTHEQANRIALAMYVGYTCTKCGYKFSSVDDVINRDPVCSQKDENGLKFACKECFKK